ncbi:alpha-E domain-containing protein [Catelliglobosispora koreensis]|uniref:alpha-E domain-containing protein n=1 Tax=Catelliglobosispora koreensis TaxID=129052 RepID=UPI00037226FD|nr:alpha-E domain-containing protein [Catelliglobosispora koreensis]
MLSRIAESLYWIGRYAERAEGTARILDVHVHGMLQDPWVDQEEACRSLLKVMGVTTDATQVSTLQVVSLLGLEQASPSSVVGALAAARENARGARETISTEMWECLNATWLGLPAARIRIEQQGMHAFFGWVRERCSLLNGLTEATMSRDDGWLFLMLGRSIERADMTARLLSTHADAGGSIQSWLSLLRSCGAWETFLRTYRGALTDRHAAEFLLLDRLFPRSAFAALSAAESCLDELEQATGPRAGVATDAHRIIGRARTDLEFRGVDELLSNLSSVLSTVERACSRANTAITGRYFRATAAVTWAVA